MITNEQYLVQRFSEALEKFNQPGNNEYKKYWQGVTDTYQSLLFESFNGWALPGTIGYFVLYEGMSYDAAISAWEKENLSFEQDQANYHSEKDPETKYWEDSATYNERHSYETDELW
jgi:hypothetical protein